MSRDGHLDEGEFARYLDDASAPRGWGVALAFGPGVSIEALLMHRC